MQFIPSSEIPVAEFFPETDFENMVVQEARTAYNNEIVACNLTHKYSWHEWVWRWWMNTEESEQQETDAQYSEWASRQAYLASIPKEEWSDADEEYAMGA